MMVVMLVLVFTGQVLASAKSSCQSGVAQSSEPMMASDCCVDHSQHLNSDASLADETAALDCCPDCDCILGGCTTAAVLPVSQSLFISYIGSVTPHDNVLALTQLSTSLFRPPISR